MYMTNDLPKVASMLQSESSHVLTTGASNTGASNTGATPRVAPWTAMGMQAKSAFSTMGSPAFGPLVIVEARVRDAKQAAPPRGPLS